MIATTKTDGIIEGITTVTAETQEETTSEIEIQIVETQEETTSEIEIQTVETQEEATSEIEIQIVETQEEQPENRDSNRRDSGRGNFRDRDSRNRSGGREKKIFADNDWTCTKCNNSNFSFRKECNRCGEPKSGNSKEETTEEGETNRQEMTGEVGMTASQENSEKPE